MSLHDTHDWGERSFRDDDGTRMIPVCLDCRVDGFENEPAAFQPCPGATLRCGATMESSQVPGHSHVCDYEHKAGDHHCRDCHRWFWVT